MPSPNLPVLGAALTLPWLRTYRDWLRSADRDVEVQDFFDAAVLDGDWRPLAAEVRRELDGHKGRIGVHGPFWGFNIATQDPAVRTVVTKRLLQGLDVCEALKATQMVVHSPYTTWDHNNLDYTPGARGKSIERVHQALEPVVRRASDIGVTLVIENIEDVDPHLRVELARSFASPSVRVSLDTGHANYAHHATGGPPVDYYVHAAGIMLEHVHLQDTDGYADRHWAPGEGNIPWAELFRALELLPAMPRLIIELRDRAHVMAGAEHLTRHGLAR